MMISVIKMVMMVIMVILNTKYFGVPEDRKNQVEIIKNYDDVDDQDDHDINDDDGHDGDTLHNILWRT